MAAHRNSSDEISSPVPPISSQSPAPIQVAAEDTIKPDFDKEYYDIIIVGKTGQGKSTTSDKMIIANKEIPVVPQDYNVEVKPHKLSVADLTFWTIEGRVPDDAAEKITEYLKSLDYNNSLEDSHLKLNISREKEGNPVTSSCQLVSNDITSLRVLDVPGFFSVISTRDETALPDNDIALPDDSAHQDPLTFAAITGAQRHHSTMRDILRIQSTMKLKLRRIMYFLPVRGPLEKSDMIIKQDLQLMAYYFDKSIFDCMVLVATINKGLSLKYSQEDLFSDEDFEQTRTLFRKTLQDVLPLCQEEDLPNPPLIFISMRETRPVSLSCVR